jgi:hypothetical protein
MLVGTNCRLFAAVLFGVNSSSVFRMFAGLGCVAGGTVGVMTRFFVISTFVMLCGFNVMARRMGVVL